MPMTTVVFATVLKTISVLAFVFGMSIHLQGSKFYTKRHARAELIAFVIFLTTLLLSFLVEAHHPLSR